MLALVAIILLSGCHSNSDYETEQTEFERAPLVLESVRHSNVLGVSVVEFGHRHCFLIGQRGVRAAEAF